MAAHADPSQWELWAQFASALTAINQAPLIATRANLRAITELERRPPFPSVASTGTNSKHRRAGDSGPLASRVPGRR